MSIIRPNAEPPVTAIASGDIFLIDGSTGVRALAATSVAIYDANGNTTVNNLLEGFTSTATAGATTTLTVASAAQQFFTGTLAQTVVLPVVSTFAEPGAGYFFQNSSTGAITVTSSGGNTVKVIGPGAFAIITCISLTGTSAASWQATYFGDIVISGRVLTVNNSLGLSGTDGTVMTFPSTSATLARTDAGQTFTGTQAFGALTATSLNGNTFTAGTGVLTIAAAKTLTASNSLTLAGTDGTVMTFPSTSATLARTDAGQTFTGTQAFGALTATSLNGNTFTAGTGVLTIAAAKTLTASNSLTLAGTDGTVMTFQGTDTYVGRATADALTNKTFDTAGVGNVFKVNGTAISTNTGTGANVLATSPTLITPILGAATATSINGNTITAGTGILTIAAAKTLTVSNSLTLAGTDGSTLNVGAGGTLGSNAFTSTAFAPLASPTLTGTPAAPTATTGTNTTQIATTAFVAAAVTASTTGVASIAGNTGAFTLGTGLTNAGNVIQLSTPVSNANGGLGNTAGAWTAWTPTVTPGSGAFTTVSAAGAWYAIGKLVHFSVTITITTAGTATGSMSIPLPTGTANRNAAVFAQDFDVTGMVGFGRILSGSTTLNSILKYDNTTYITSGNQVVLTGIYEQQ